jgi:hypothetical protein
VFVVDDFVFATTYLLLVIDNNLSTAHFASNSTRSVAELVSTSSKQIASIDSLFFSLDITIAELSHPPQRD